MTDLGIPEAIDAIFRGIERLIERLLIMDWRDPLFWIVSALLLIMAYNLTRRRAG